MPDKLVMGENSEDRRTQLRTGFSTGACATATALAAARLLLTNESTRAVSIELPRGERVDFALVECVKTDEQSARASTIKDAGDDPDVTHLATVFCEVQLSLRPGVRFHAAEGVGIVTREGLSIAVGEPAINPVPRAMITGHLDELAEDCDYSGGFEVAVGVRDGEKLALKTMNGRLGIVGGLSILGTTGIVRPFSCAAYIASIHQSIDVAHANGIEHIAACTGSTSERTIQDALQFPDMALVEMGDFAGAVFKHLRKVPMRKLSICGGFGKISKLAAGNTSLHSRDSSINLEFIATVAAELGADPDTLRKMREGNTSLEALALCREQGVELGNAICGRAKSVAFEACRERLDIDVYCIDKSGGLVGDSLERPDL